MAKKIIPENIANPFSDSFLDIWDMWKQFRFSYDKFKYKGVFSEQMALKKLCELSGGDEIIAREIIEQSISRQWTGFYELKNKVNGQPKPKETADFRDSVKAAFRSRYSAGK